MAKAATTTIRRTIYRVQYKRGRWLPWVVVLKSEVLYAFERKAKAIERARWLAYLKEPSQVVIYGRNGKIQREMTFPRSSDPRRHKG